LSDFYGTIYVSVRHKKFRLIKRVTLRNLSAQNYYQAFTTTSKLIIYANFNKNITTIL